MTQQIIALLIIFYFIYQQTSLYKKQALSKNEYYFWLAFWLVASGMILAIHYIDALVLSLGFSASGISVLTELAVAILFYFIFRLRLRIAKLEKDITIIVEKIALEKK